MERYLKREAACHRAHKVCLSCTLGTKTYMQHLTASLVDLHLCLLRNMWNPVNNISCFPLNAFQASPSYQMINKISIVSDAVQTKSRPTNRVPAKWRPVVPASQILSR